MKTKLMIAALLACLVPAAAIAAPAGHPGRHQHQNQDEKRRQLREIRHVHGPPREVNQRPRHQQGAKSRQRTC